MKTRLIAQIWLFCILVAIVPVLLAADLEASLDWSDKRRLGTTVSAQVDKVSVRPGMQVKKGDVLVELDQRYFKIMEKESRSRMQHAQLLLEEAQREQERAIELFDRTVLSVYERQQADIELANAAAVHAAAKAAFEKARLDIEFSKVISPYNGVVLNVLTAPGEVVVNENEATVLVELARSDEMLARVQLSGDQVSRLQIGQQIEVAFRGKWQTGQVHSISLQSDATGSKAPGYLVSVSLSVAESDHARAGESSAVRLPD